MLIFAVMVVKPAINQLILLLAKHYLVYTLFLTLNFFIILETEQKEERNMLRLTDVRKKAMRMFVWSSKTRTN